MSEHEADQALRDLFRQAGPFTAPDSVDAGVLQRIALTARPAPIPEKPLLPRWAWLVGGLFLPAIALLPSGGKASTPSWLEKIPQFPLEKVLGSPWMMMALAAGVILIGLDIWLSARRLAHQAH